ncbi:unnamed protein product [Brachionus calyciflorus]|uniref:Uncharacterized protein n=1 Tax=Brachionus calyciflorus TaxID=104777 RepID=A0A813W0D1_9BILA|nr:unnamed protein product [Brachionus calyciflorus]
MVARVKHNVGKDLARVWMFGMMCRSDDLCYIEIVPDRTQYTLLRIFVPDLVLDEPATHLEEKSDNDNLEVNVEEESFDPRIQIIRRRYQWKILINQF